MAGKKNVVKSKTRTINRKTQSSTLNAKGASGSECPTLEEIEPLGGNKSDLKLIGDLDDTGEEIIEGFDKEWDTEPIKHDEIKDFIKSLELYKYRNLSVVSDEAEESNKQETPSLETEKEDLSSVEKSIQKEKELPQKRKKGKKNKYKIQDDEVSSTTETVLQSGVSWKKSSHLDWGKHIAAYKPRKYLLVKTGQRWYDEDNTENIGQTLDAVTQQMEQFASKLLADEVALYKKQRENNKRSDSKWLKTVLASGTLSDKMAALTLLAGESPVHNLASMDSLINMAKKKGKREAMAAVDALRDLFLSDLLPGERKLKTFHQHSLHSLERLASGNKDTVDKILILWYYEAQLKEKYAAFIKAVDMMSYDTLAAPKQKALSVMHQLLANKPEGEKVLLPMLVNKLGDPDYKIAAKCSHLLTKLVGQHPNMNSVVVEAVEAILYRPNISKRAQYYAMCFLNQTVLEPEDEELASQLVKIYFSFFRAFVQNGEVDSKMMSALLTGVNRAFPFTKGEKEYLNEQLNHLYKIVHMVNFNTSLQALLLLHHVTDSSDSVSDRFYMALYKKLADPALKTSSKQAMFLNLIFKTLRNDTSEKRIKAFIKRLLQVCAFHSPQFVCGVLFMLSEVIKKRPDIINFAQSFEDSDDDEEHFVDMPDEEEETVVEQKNSRSEKPKEKAKSSWIHRRNKQDKISLGTYDPFHRNPQYCGADQACMWELKKLSKHYHPSVSLFAQTLLQKSTIQYTSDPLQDFTLIKFLDRFVYKNPKKHQQVAKSVMSAKQSIPRNMVAVTSETFIDRDEASIPEDEKYLHKYFNQKSVRDQGKGDDSDAESVSDSEFDAFLDNFESGADQGEDLEEFDMDFAGEFGKKKDQSKGKKRAKAVDEEESDEDDEGLSDEEMEFDEDDELAAAFKAEMDAVMGGGGDVGFDEEEIEFSDEDEFETEQGKRTLDDDEEEEDEDIGKRPKKKTKFKKDSESLFAAAEEFSHLLDDNAGTSLDMLGGTHAMSNTDNASLKQMKWETDREKWIKGQSWKSKRGPKWNKGGKFKPKGGKFKNKGSFKGKQGKKSFKK